MCSLSRLNNDVATSSTWIYSSGTARLGGCTMNNGRFPSGFPTQIPWTRWTLFPVCFLFLSFSFLWFPSFVDVRFVYALEYTAITSLLIFWCFHVLPDLSRLSFHTFDLCYIFESCGQIFRPALMQAHWTERVWNRVFSNLSIWHLIFPPFLCTLW